MGEYYTTNKGWNYSIELWPDSTFRYIKRYEWPIDVSLGRWHVKNNKLILNSIEDTFSQRKLTSSTYIMLVEKSYRIKRNSIVDDSSRLKYKLYKK
jgi:hypothetical protein